MILPTDRYDLENVTYFTNSQFVTYLHFSVSNFLGQSPTYFMSHEGNMFFLLDIKSTSQTLMKNIKSMWHFSLWTTIVDLERNKAL